MISIIYWFFAQSETHSNYVSVNLLRLLNSKKYFLTIFLPGGQNSCLAGNMLASWATFLAYRQNSCLAGHNAPSC